ncbi:hypothetical protein BHC49_03435 [Snodgrassella alvi]|uniref:Uncharacterized protein n=1 Tax=Snodgrassella alvi TaxID=1196083 RepID=A0A2N9XZP2_9NEIS|nr:hypothetical protein BHC49_03805 [Snodgrassella alvi]PIT57386.1 hypothetical protein BHC49_03435 [Snodgrassella alvi]
MLPHKETGTSKVKTDRLIDQSVCFLLITIKNMYFVLYIISSKNSIAGYSSFSYNKTFIITYIIKILICKNNTVSNQAHHVLIDT